jgi:hypothetical protein
MAALGVLMYTNEKTFLKMGNNTNEHANLLKSMGMLVMTHPESGLGSVLVCRKLQYKLHLDR